ncbi:MULTISPECIES: hypothetical protein [unclassified Lactococcus]|uniref:hypothetical protein n=1 Tax=unclassified Lactococcus TaxID=2643510 RepID=UPI001C9C4B80|nr:MULTISPECIES: hypothetical protein [unclassified Lactococcus]
MTLAIKKQGSYAVGGTIITNEGTFDGKDQMNPQGQSLHGDHARVSFQIPENVKGLPILMWHGWWEDSSSWDTTSDGRDGFKTIFAEKGFPVYLIDQARRGSAGKTTVATPINTTPNEQWFFNQFRLGTWPDFFDNVQFSREPEALNQFFRAMVPDTGSIESDLLVAGTSAAVDSIGDTILMTHSHAEALAGLLPWQTTKLKRSSHLNPALDLSSQKTKPLKP